MFRFFLGAATINVSLFGYANYWRKKHVDEVYENMGKDLQEKIYNDCPTNKYLRGNDGLSAINEKILTNHPSLHENDKPLKSFKS